MSPLHWQVSPHVLSQVHGDVFRPAANPMLFSALIGAGSQIAVVVLFVILFAILGELYTERGSLLSTAIFVYAATAPVNGYFGGSLYARCGHLSSISDVW